jgi:hypothetical protein
MYPALALCVLITAAAFVLSQRYDSQTIAAFAAIGGYMPILSVAGDARLIHYAIGYFVLLNIFSLLVSVYKKWRVAQFIGFAMNIGSICYTVLLLDLFNAESSKYFAVLYAFLGFAVYNAIPAVSSYRTGVRLGRPDNVLLILNTIFSSLMMFWIFAMFRLWDKAGLLAIVFCILYLLMAGMVRRMLKDENTCQALFYITGLTYAVLAIPLQLDIAYLSLGWLVEGVLLLSYGIWAENKAFQKAGTVISSLCLLAFLLLDFLLSGPLFFYKYLFVTLASAVVLVALISKNKAVSGAGSVYKCIVVINLWSFLLYAMFTKLRPELAAWMGDGWLGWYFTGAAAITVSLCYAYVIARQRFVSGGAVRAVSVGIYVLSVLAVIKMNTVNARVYMSGYPAALTVTGTVLIAVINLLAVLTARDLILRLTLGKVLGAEWYPLILSAFFVFVVMQNLIVVFDLSLNNVVITAILAATALGWIIFGFIKRYLYIRLSGLGLSFLTVIKLFIVDLGFLSAGIRIVSYFMLGVTLLAISFVYQYFSKKLDAPNGGD